MRELLAKLEFALRPERTCHDLGGAVANAVRDIVTGDVEGLAVLGNAADQDMGLSLIGMGWLYSR